MRISILTLFPEFFTTPLSSSILKRAVEQQHVEFQIVDIRSFTTDRHRTTDDRPYGGGPGMVLMVEPIARALEHTQPEWPHPRHKRFLTSAKGELFTQSTAQQFSELEDLVLICGHYEGVDERVAAHLVDGEVRVGDYVLTGGEPAALILLDSVTRLLPGVLGNDESLLGESHGAPGQFAPPQYTRPAEYRGWKVPEVLLNGNHAAIAAWKRAEAQKSTRE